MKYDDILGGYLQDIIKSIDTNSELSDAPVLPSTNVLLSNVIRRGNEFC